jgi:hypothetical protein
MQCGFMHLREICYDNRLFRHGTRFGVLLQGIEKSRGGFLRRNG